MNNTVVIATSRVTAADLPGARLGTRFGRLDPFSQLALLAVERLAVNFETLPRDRIGICLSARGGSLSTDHAYWERRDATGGPSPTLFAYTLPSAAIGEIAIRHHVTGPNLCLVDGENWLEAEAADLIQRGEADACVCIACNVVTAPIAALTGLPPVAEAHAFFLTRHKKQEESNNG
jgi:3-oxoacyl-(acyl-carrier-protein) synthase